LVTLKNDALCVEWWIDPKSHVEFVGFSSSNAYTCYKNLTRQPRRCQW
jgi:hypothetical protein